MIDELSTLFATFAATIPEHEDSNFVFSSTNIPVPSRNIRTSSIVIRKGKHGYQAYSITISDVLHFHAHKQSYRLLALLLLAKVFHETPAEICLHLEHPDSQVQTLILGYTQLRPSELFIGFHTRPHQLLYWPNTVTGYTRMASLPENLLPQFSLTNEIDSRGFQQEEWEQRNIVRCTGSEYGNVAIAHLLLNLSRKAEKAAELHLESEHGNRSLGIGSAEVTFWLPGSSRVIASNSAYQSHFRAASGVKNTDRSGVYTISENRCVAAAR